MAEQESDIRTCPVCRESIPPLASKCRYCGTFQNWRRYINVSSSFLSLLLAIISVSTVLITVLSQTVSEQRSEIDAALVSWQRTYYQDRWGISQVLIAELLVSNRGERPGIVRQVTVKATTDGEHQLLTETIHNPTDVSKRPSAKAEILEPGETLLLRRHLSAHTSPDKFAARFSHAELSIDVINFDGSERSIILEVIDRPPVLP